MIFFFIFKFTAAERGNQLEASYEQSSSLFFINQLLSTSVRETIDGIEQDYTLGHLIGRSLFDDTLQPKVSQHIQDYLDTLFISPDGNAAKYSVSCAALAINKKGLKVLAYFEEKGDGCRLTDFSQTYIFPVSGTSYYTIRMEVQYAS